jgi:hypothetical protein
VDFSAFALLALGLSAVSLAHFSETRTKAGLDHLDLQEALVRYLQAEEIHETVLLVKLLPMQVLVEGHRVIHTSLTQCHGHTNHYAVFELLMSCLPLEQWGYSR